MRHWHCYGENKMQLDRACERVIFGILLSGKLIKIVQ